MTLFGKSVKGLVSLLFLIGNGQLFGSRTLNQEQVGRLQGIAGQYTEQRELFKGLEKKFKSLSRRLKQYPDALRECELRLQAAQGNQLILSEALAAFERACERKRITDAFRDSEAYLAHLDDVSKSNLDTVRVLSDRVTYFNELAEPLKRKARRRAVKADKLDTVPQETLPQAEVSPAEAIEGGYAEVGAAVVPNDTDPVEAGLLAAAMDFVADRAPEGAAILAMQVSSALAAVVGQQVIGSQELPALAEVGQLADFVNATIITSSPDNAWLVYALVGGVVVTAVLLCIYGQKIVAHFYRAGTETKRPDKARVQAEMAVGDTVESKKVARAATDADRREKVREAAERKRQEKARAQAAEDARLAEEARKSAEKRGRAREQALAAQLAEAKQREALLAKALAEAKEVSLCAICLEKPRTHAFMPCGHKCLCGSCSVKILTEGTDCSICRGSFTSIRQIFD